MIDVNDQADPIGDFLQTSTREDNSPFNGEHGCLTLPPGIKVLVDLPRSPRRVPLVMILHGVTGWKEEHHLGQLARDLVSAGIGAVRFDTPGLNMREILRWLKSASNDPCLEGITEVEARSNFSRQFPLTNYLETIPIVLDYAVEHLPVLPSAVGIWGHCMGAVVALAAPLHQPGRFAAVGSIQPTPGRVVEGSPEELEWRWDGWKILARGLPIGALLPESFTVARHSFDVFGRSEEILLPKLLIAGTRDEVAPSDTVRELFEALPERKCLQVIDADHGYRNRPDALREVNGLSTAFFLASLSGESQ